MSRILKPPRVVDTCWYSSYNHLKNNWTKKWCSFRARQFPSKISTCFHFQHWKNWEKDTLEMYVRTTQFCWPTPSKKNLANQWPSIATRPRNWYSTLLEKPLQWLVGRLKSAPIELLSRTQRDFVAAMGPWQFRNSTFSSPIQGLGLMSQCFTSPNYWGYNFQQIFVLVMWNKSPKRDINPNPCHPLSLSHALLQV